MPRNPHRFVVVLHLAMLLTGSGLMAPDAVKLFWGERNNVMAQIDDLSSTPRLSISSAINFHEWHSMVAQGDWPKLWRALAAKLGRSGDPPGGVIRLWVTPKK